MFGRQTSTYELLSNNMYYLKASSLECTIQSKDEAGESYSYLKIIPRDFESMELNNNRLTVGGRIHGGREFIERKEILNHGKIDKLLSEFRGTIIGYPRFQFLVDLYNESEQIKCDVISIRGGYRHNPPYYGYCQLSVDFISFLNDATIQKRSYDISDVGKKFKIVRVPKVGQIIGLKDAYGQFLNPSYLDDFINGVYTSYMGKQPYAWQEVRGNITTDSCISSLTMDISFDSKLIHFHYNENLYEHTYEIISHSSMDPGNDECTESTDRYVWATIAINEKTLVEIIKTLSTSPLVSMIGDNYIKFAKPIKKSEFKELIGVHLFESIIETSTRY